MTTYRVGNHQPQNIYRDDQYIGVMFDAEDAAFAVKALNIRERALQSFPAAEDENLTTEDMETFKADVVKAIDAAIAARKAQPVCLLAGDGEHGCDDLTAEASCRYEATP